MLVAGPRPATVSRSRRRDGGDGATVAWPKGASGDGHGQPRAYCEPGKHRLKTCATGDSEGGYRSAIAASLLQKLGRSETRDLVGGFKAWLAAKLPTAM